MAQVSKTAQARWDHCLQYIREHVSEEQYATWFSPICLLDYSEKERRITLGIPSDFFREYLEGNFVNVYSRALITQFGRDIHLFFQILKDKEHNLTTQEEVDVKPQPLAPQAQTPAPFDSQLNASLSFESFIEGESNRLVASVGRAIAEHPEQTTFNPLFIHGSSGVGKTHLVNAIGLRLTELHPGERVLYVSAHTFMVQFTTATQKNTTNDFIAFYQSISTLIIDDIQELAGMKGTLNAFFHIFNHLKQNGRQIILTADREPSSLTGMEERLLTRFLWGLTAEIGKPDRQMRLAILKKKVQHDGLAIPRNVLEYIADNVKDSVRDLEGVIHSLQAHSIVYNRDIDLNLCQRVLHHAVRLDKKPVTLDDILTHTCRVMNISRADITGRSRRAPIVRARQTVMYLAQKLTNLSTSRIGTLVGDRNHATVIHSVQAIRCLAATDERLRSQLAEIEQAARQH